MFETGSIFDVKPDKVIISPAMTDDDRIEAEYINKLPLFVSIPRSGCNWLQPVLEVYFNRHRVMKHPNSPSWMTTPVENPLWMHAHDNFHDKLNIKTDKPVVFLYRDIVDVIYSMHKLHPMHTEQKLVESVERYKRCFNKWVNGAANEHGTGPVLTIDYQQIVDNPHEVVKSIHEHWKDYHDLGSEFDLSRSIEAFDVVGNKQDVSMKNGQNRNFKHPEAGTMTYESGRDEFRDKWGSYILSV